MTKQPWYRWHSVATFSGKCG